MYFIFGFFIFLCILFLFLFFCRRKRIQRRICDMMPCEKIEQLNRLIRPFGFFYDGCQDVFSSATDAWQRELGYRALFDRSAPRFNMVFDCEPIYFDHDGRTWLIEFWKGQYGINTGAEIGIYYADRILAPREYSRARFNSVPDEQMLPLQMELRRQGESLFTLQELHWWLTGFRMGVFCSPGELELEAALTIPDDEMLQSFVGGLLQAGYDCREVSLCDHTVSFTFTTPKTKRRGFLPGLRSAWAQWKNKRFVELYLHVTRPFTCTVNKLLYLYYFLPFAFRRSVGIRRRRHRQGRRS